jgi:3-deoxy-manno-octulosonate cytidylyltransferase (CMP-KDO synthetase)
MVEHVFRRAADARGIDAVVVATDDRRVADAVERFGGIARMTALHHGTGMDRVAEVVRDLRCSIVVNVQGDEPLVDPAALSSMIDALRGDAHLEMATLRTPIRREQDYASPHVVKVVVDGLGDALYFSRAPIPFHRDRPPGRDLPPESGSYGYKHLGLYAYRRDFLLRLAELPQTALERSESLEQLRALEHGHRIRVLETLHDSIGVDTPEDLERVRSAFASMRVGETASR